MAERQEANFGSPKPSAGATPVDPKQNGRPASAKQGKDGQQQVDREERLRILKEKQNEERQRKLDELKQQALAAQKFRDQKEEERRRRLEELRVRDTDRRHQVEERKRQIWEAERDRREAILRKNQEREARIESKRKNERSSIVFAFGSSTPRMLEPGDAGSIYWSTRRATSTSNVMTLSLSAAPGPLTRRSSERELEGSKKRATSAGGIERKNQDEVRRRKTDLTPVVPLADRDATPPRRSKPGRAYSMSRLDVLSRPRRPTPAPAAPAPGPPGPPAPAPLVKGAARSMVSLGPPRPTRAERLRRRAREQARSQSLEASQQNTTLTSPQGARSGDITPSRPQSSLSQHSVSSQLSSASASLRARTPRRPRPVSIAVTGVSSPGSERSVKSPNVNAPEKPPIPKVHTTTKKSLPNKNETTPKKPTDKPKSSKSSASTTPKTTPLQSPLVECPEGNLLEEDIQPLTPAKADYTKPPSEQPVRADTINEDKPSREPTTERTVGEEATKTEISVIEKQRWSREESPPPQGDQPATPASAPAPGPVQPVEEVLDLAEADMTSSMIAKIRITTEEEAKAALAERRRFAREQAEREAEMERQRIEAERLAEEERLRKEEEDQRRMEEEQLRLLEEARKSEEIRLQQAIEEAQKREEEEKKRKEEELKQKLEKEEAEKKAKEEAEKMRIEMEIRLKKEEEDRQARRKRVEAIMLRTRGKGSVTSSSTPSKDGEDGEDISPPEEAKKSSEDDKFLESERSHSDANCMEEQALSPSTKQNGHHNGSIDSVSEIMVTNSLIELSSHESVGDILEHAGGNGKLPEAPFRPFQGGAQSQTVNDLLS